MKSIFNKGMGFALLVSVLVFPIAAESQVFFSVRELLADQFKLSEKVEYKRVHAEGETRKKIERKLGYKLKTQNFVVYIASSKGDVDGYAIFDTEIGQHEAIDFATFFDPQGKVTRVEIVAYREPYGAGIRSPRFRDQFVGRSASSGFATNHDIDIVTGATLSARAMAKTVQRAAVLISTTVLDRQIPKQVDSTTDSLASR